MISADRLVPPHITNLQAYEPGLDAQTVKRRFGLARVIKLASNENPFGASPNAIERARHALSGISRYNDGGLALRSALARHFGVRIENVIVGAGSEGIMANIVRTFLSDDDEVLTTDAAFAGFQVLAHSRGVGYRTVPYREWRYDLAALADAISSRTKLIYLANPNNPTGTFFSRAEFELFHARVPERVLIILDEAYFEFAAGNPLYPDSLNYRFDNVITLRTFSKAYGLAAARIGYGFAHEALIEILLKIKLPFEPGGLGSAAALGALEDREFVAASVANNDAGLKFLNSSFRELGIEIAPASGNFVLLVFPGPEHAERIFQALLRRGVIVRQLRGSGLPQCLRASVGTPEENSIFVQSLEEILSNHEVDEYAATC
jgi:histidinol-phosphate aminotransferase